MRKRYKVLVKAHIARFGVQAVHVTVETFEGTPLCDMFNAAFRSAKEFYNEAFGENVSYNNMLAANFEREE